MLSNGNAVIAVKSDNTLNGSSTKQNTTNVTETDLVALSASMGYSQKLFDINILTFDITPTVSGPVVFSYVFGRCDW